MVKLSMPHLLAEARRSPAPPVMQRARRGIAGNAPERRMTPGLNRARLSGRGRGPPDIRHPGRPSGTLHPPPRPPACIPPRLLLTPQAYLFASCAPGHARCTGALWRAVSPWRFVASAMRTLDDKPWRLSGIRPRCLNWSGWLESAALQDWNNFIKLGRSACALSYPPLARARALHTRSCTW